MTKGIREIFEHNIQLIGDMDKAVYYFREQQYDKALSLMANSIDQVKLVIEAIISNRDYFNLVKTESMLEMLKGLLEAKKNRDFILLADLLELQLVSFLLGVQELIISKEEITFSEENYDKNIKLLMEHQTGFKEDLKKPISTTDLLEKGYRVEFTSCGLMTLAAENDGTKFYFHSNSKAMSEAFLLARYWYKKEKKRYILYGFGMGYHVFELLSIAKDAEIEIYESDRNVLQLACAFSEIKELILNKNIKFIYDPELNMLNERITKLEQEEALLVHYPSFHNIRCKEGKEKLLAKVSWPEAIYAC